MFTKESGGVSGRAARPNISFTDLCCSSGPSASPLDLSLSDGEEPPLMLQSQVQSMMLCAHTDGIRWSTVGGYGSGYYLY